MSNREQTTEAIQEAFSHIGAHSWFVDRRQSELTAKMKFLIALAFLPMVVYGHGLEAPSCPPFWTGFGETCYRYFPDPLSFADAEATCAQFAPCNSFEIGSLVVLSERNKERFLETALNGLVAQPPAPDVWAGLSDRVTEGTFAWVNGDPLVYNNWATGQPDNGRSSGVAAQNCVMYSPALGGWDDVQCDLTLPFYCEMPYEKPQLPPMFGPVDPGRGPNFNPGAGRPVNPGAGRPNFNPGAGGPGQNPRV